MKPTVWIIILEALFVFLSGWGAFLINIHHKLTGISLLLFWAGTIFSALGLRVALKNHHKTKPFYSRWFWGISGATTLGAIAVLVWVNAQVDPAPHLTLVLNTSDSASSPSVNLMFTNSFLFVPRYKPPAPLKFPERSAFLVVRVPPDHTKVVLRFAVLNDSAPQYADVDDSLLTADVVHLEFLISPSDSANTYHWSPSDTENTNRSPLRWVADDQWKQKEFGTDGTKILHFAFPRPILPGLGESAPTITCQLNEMGSDPSAIMARIRAKHVPNIDMIFKLLLIRSNTAIPPSFEMNNIGVMLIDMTPSPQRTN